MAKGGSFMGRIGIGEIIFIDVTPRLPWFYDHASDRPTGAPVEVPLWRAWVGIIGERTRTENPRWQGPATPSRQLRWCSPKRCGARSLHNFSPSPQSLSPAWWSWLIWYEQGGHGSGEWWWPRWLLKPWWSKEFRGAKTRYAGKSLFVTPVIVQDNSAIGNHPIDALVARHRHAIGEIRSRRTCRPIL